MSHEDFDVAALSAHLHLAPNQVTRLADRAKLPGRKVAGQWRFSRAEIHHWLEERIGLCDDDDELAQMEDVLQADRARPQTLSITAMLDPQNIACPLAARTRNSVIRAMSELAAATGMLWDPDKMLEAVRARENLHPTALDNGVALLHPRRPLPSILGESVLALGITPQGIPFGGGGLTDIFFLVCSTSDREHLRILARLSRLIADASLLNGLRTAEDAKTVHRLISEAEINLG